MSKLYGIVYTIKSMYKKYLRDIPSGNLPYFDHSLVPNHQFCIFHLDRSEYYPAEKYSIFRLKFHFYAKSYTLMSR